MILRAALLLLALTAAAAAWVWAADPEVTIDPATAGFIGWQAGKTDAEIVREAVREAATPAALSARIEDAVTRADAADAAMYLAIADDAGFAVAPGLRARAQAVIEGDQSFWAQAGDFFDGFIRGSSDSLPGFFGAVASDFTVVGDVRDIGLEGGKMVAGEPYSEFILGLSVVGLAATTATVATGGGGAIVKAGVSFLKFAKRAGHLTAEFAARLTRLSSDAVDLPAFKQVLRRLDVTDFDGSMKAITDYAAKVQSAEIFRVIGSLEEMRAAAGTPEAIRLLKRIQTVENLDDLRDLSKVTGKRTRGIVELTAKSSLRAFKYTVKALRLALEYLWALLTWLAALILPVLWRIVKIAGGFGRRRRAVANR